MVKKLETLKQGSHILLQWQNLRLIILSLSFKKKKNSTVKYNLLNFYNERLKLKFLQRYSSDFSCSYLL